MRIDAGRAYHVHFVVLGLLAREIDRHRHMSVRPFRMVQVVNDTHIHS